MSDRAYPPYRVYPTEGGWRISTPHTRRFPSYAKRAAVYPTVWDALFRLLNHMHVKWRDIGWMCLPERTGSER